MKKYSSGSFVDAALRVYGSEADTISSFPASIITNGGNITPWSIYGNTSGGQSVGEKTANLFDKNQTFGAGYYDDNGDLHIQTGDNATEHTELIPTNGTTTFTIKGLWTYESGLPAFAVYEWDSSKNWLRRSNRTTVINTETPITFNIGSDTAYISLQVMTKLSGFDYATTMLNTGSTALPYEPYGYKLPVVIGSTTTNIYMADVLRMSSGADPVYDVMSSTGTITRNVDTDGSALPTPTTESFTAPTLATVAGSQSFTVDTTVKPSSVSLTYTGWHTHADKQYSGGSWGQVTSNAKVLRRKKSAKSKT